LVDVADVAALATLGHVAAVAVVSEYLVAPVSAKQPAPVEVEVVRVQDVVAVVTLYDVPHGAFALVDQIVAVGALTG
jgi:hypothetical protein